MVACFLGWGGLIKDAPSFPQVLGEKAEMARLVERGEHALSSGDPDGAYLNMGKAALMASLLAKEAAPGQDRWLYEGAEATYRALENGYRALALFEQAGAQPPAPTGACQLLDLSDGFVQQATEKLGRFHPGKAMAKSELHRDLTRRTADWTILLPELQKEFGCL